MPPPQPRTAYKSPYSKTYHTSVWDDVIKFIDHEKNVCGSVKVFLKAHAQFIKPGDGEEIVTAYAYTSPFNWMSACKELFGDGPLPMSSVGLFDQQEPINMELMGMAHTFLTDFESFSITGSGWAVDEAADLIFFVGLVPHEPNNDPIFNSKSSCEPPNAETVKSVSVSVETPLNDEMPNAMETTPPFEHPKLSIAFFICLFQCIKGHRTTNCRPKTYEKNVAKWISNMNFPQFSSNDHKGEINPSSLPKWHSLFNHRILIRVFNERGNQIYGAGDSSFGEANLFYFSRKWQCIKNLKSFLGVSYQSARFDFCDKCHTFHSDGSTCSFRGKKFTSHKAIELRDLPKGRFFFKMYADFESFISKSDKVHHTSGYSILAISNTEVFKRITRNVLSISRGTDIIHDFIERVFKIGNEFIKEATTLIAPNEYCVICDNEFTELELNHVNSLIDFVDYKTTVIARTRSFRSGEHGFAHKRCLRKNEIPILFHNAKGYDSKFILSALHSIQKERVKLRGKSSEKFDIIQIERLGLSLKIMDTFNFLAKGLAGLVKDMLAPSPNVCANFKYTDHEFAATKGEFPYEWFDDPDKLEETSLPLPSSGDLNDAWWSSLYGECGKYEKALEVWNKKGFTSFAQYHDFYCALDTAQLCDVFERFTNSCLLEGKYDPCNFQGAPGLTWHLACKRQKNELANTMPIINDQDVYLDIRANIRGGVAQCMKRRATVVNPENHNLIYLDVNSLYSWCMMQKLPTKYLRTIPSLPTDWKNESDLMFMIKCDLDYPPHLHDRDYEMPLCPHKFDAKLCTTLHDKKNILLHSETLKFYMSRGMVLSRVYYAYVFEQGYPLRAYVTRNIEQRKATTESGMSDLFKLLNNSLYGKTCEDVLKYVKFEWVQHTRTKKGQVNPDLVSTIDMTTLGEGHDFIVKNEIGKVKLNKPIQLGWAILEWAKLKIYHLYCPLKDHFKDNMKAVYTDTDSLLLEFIDINDPWLAIKDHVPSAYAQMDWEKDKIVTLNARTENTDKVAGYWSSEYPNQRITDFVGLRAKCYALKFESLEGVPGQKLKNKGVKSSATIGGKKINFDSYVLTLNENTTQYATQTTLVSRHRIVKTHTGNRIALTSHDTKRKVLVNNIDTIAHGYRGTKREWMEDVDDRVTTAVKKAKLTNSLISVNKEIEMLIDNDAPEDVICNACDIRDEIDKILSVNISENPQPSCSTYNPC